MFFRHQHRSFFPFVVALLSLVLLVFMYYAFSYSTLDTLRVEQPSSISSADYRTNVEELVTTFENNMQLTTDPLAQLVVVEETLNTLLSLRVPVEYQSAHLQLAFALNTMKDALRSGDRDIEAGMTAWRSALTSMK